MATFEQLYCCLTPDLCTVAPPERRADCGPCIWTSGIVESSDAMVELASSKNPAQIVAFRKPVPMNDPLCTAVCVDPKAAEAPEMDTCEDCTKTCIATYRSVKQFSAQCWTHDDVQSMCSPINSSTEEFIMDHVSSEFWIRQVFENQILGMLQGITADNVANDGADMVIDVINEPCPTVDGTGETTGFNSNVHVKALGQMGCANNTPMCILMHKNLFFGRLLQQEGANCCVEVYDSERIGRSPMLANSGSVNQYTYQGYPVYICDHPMLCDMTNPAAPVYKTYYFGKGMFKFGVGRLPEDVQPFYADYEPCTNGGYGTWKWFSRVAWGLHPDGFNNDWEMGPGGAHMKMADLIDPNNWDRVVERNNVPLVVVCSN